MLAMWLGTNIVNIYSRKKICLPEIRMLRLFFPRSYIGHSEDKFVSGRVSGVVGKCATILVLDSHNMGSSAPELGCHGKQD